MVSVLLGVGDGTFNPAVTFAASSQPFGLAVGDVNGDAKQDLIVTNNLVAGTYSVLLGNGAGSFGAATTQTVGGKNPTFVAAVDVNNDAQLDLVTANPGSGDVSVLLGVGNGTFGAPSTQLMGPGCNFVAVAEGKISYYASRATTYTACKLHQTAIGYVRGSAQQYMS